MLKPESIQKNEINKTIWDFVILTDHLMLIKKKK